MTAPQPGGGVDVLRMLRVILGATSIALVLFGVVLLLVLPGSDSSTESFSPTAATGMVAILGIATAVIGARLPIALDTSTAATLVDTYRRRFFGRLAVAESAALAGFLGSILSSSFLPYAVGFCFAAIGFARLMPTDARIASDQEQLTLSGCPVPLDAALRGTAVP